MGRAGRKMLICLTHPCSFSSQDCSTAERNSQILLIVSAEQGGHCGHGDPSSAGPTPSPRFYPQCQHIIGICESIVGCSPPALLDRRAILQRVGLALPRVPRDSPPDSPSTPMLPSELWSSPPASPSTPVLPPEPPGSPPESPSTPMLPYNPLVRYPLPRCPSPSLIPPHSHLPHYPAGSGDHLHQLLPALCVHDQLGGELGPVPLLSVTVPCCHLVPPFTLGHLGHFSLSGWVLGAS